MSDQYVFEVDGARIRATPFAAGPWDPSMQHGGAPSALVARAAETFPSERPMRVARMTIDLLRPVPVGELDIETEVVREGRKIQLLQVRLVSGGKECMRATVLKLRDETLELPAHEGFRPLELTPPSEDEPSSAGFGPSHGFGSGMSAKIARGEWGKPGPAAVWFRAERPIVRGEATTPLMSAALTADFCNGVSSVLDFQKFTYINGDLTVSFARRPVGRWILLDAETWVGDSGGALAFARLADRNGYFGRAVQSVLVEKR
ncbi:thioesterase family protein [Caulobacter mirabilis]|nr:thioesterase family protein [Caulobacter mirabilis]